MYGMTLARYQKHPEVKTRGMTGMKPLIAFTSDQVGAAATLTATYDLLDALPFRGGGSGLTG